MICCFGIIYIFLVWVYTFLIIGALTAIDLGLITWVFVSYIGEFAISVLVKAEVSSKIGVEDWRVEVVSIIDVLIMKAAASNLEASNEDFVLITKEKSNSIISSVVGAVSIIGELVANDDKSKYWIVVVKSNQVIPVVSIVAFGNEDKSNVRVDSKEGLFFLYFISLSNHKIKLKRSQ